MPSLSLRSYYTSRSLQSQSLNPSVRNRWPSISLILNPPPVTKTVVAMPSLSLRSYYTSRSLQSQSLNPSILEQASLGSGVAEAFQKSGKKANFYLFTALESMPRETIITPHIMSFFEEALEPIHDVSGGRSLVAWQRDQTGPVDEAPPPSAGGVGTGGAAVDVEVILYFLVQSSTIRFTTASQPSLTGVECLLRLPSLHLVFSRRDGGGEDGKEGHSAHSGPGGINCSASFKDFSLAIFHPYSATADLSSPRKDYLTLTVDAIAFHFSRSRHFVQTTRNREFFDLENSVRFSVVVDINKAYFNYDMRRLKDILTFPKAWYRPAIARRFFLGQQDRSNVGLGGDTSEAGGGSERATPKPPSLPTQTQTSSSGSWDALGLLQFHFAELRLDAEMGATMGQTSWITKELSTRGRVRLASGGDQSVSGEFRMASSHLSASRGIISGRVSLGGLALGLSARRCRSAPPSHSVRLSLDKAETAVDWMSSQILIATASRLRLSVADTWRSERDTSGNVLISRVDLMGNVHWSDLAIVITKKTVNDFIRIHLKLLEFFEQQVKRTRQILTIPLIKEGTRDESFAADAGIKYRHHHHWQKVLRRITEIQFVEDFFPLPQQKTVLSGRVELGGDALSLACIHGAGKGSFQMMGQGQWALFHLLKLELSFAVSAEYVVATDADGEPTTDTLVDQELHLSLGRRYEPHEQPQQRTEGKESLARTRALVARVQQGRKTAPRMSAPVQDWVDYLVRSVVATILGTEAPGGYRTGDHSLAVLFRLPACHLRQASKQQQPEEEPEELLDTALGAVRFHFLADFRDHLFISSNVESIYFLHDLVHAYIQERGAEERVGGESGEDREVPGPLGKDARTFESLDWRLEPSIRFLESSNTDIIGVDFVLKKLGFDHAQTTIPKWIQRGAMDPLDAVAAQLLYNLLHIATRTPIN